jgi:predicted ATPase
VIADEMTVFLEGLAAQFYRGIGAETQFIAPFGTMNFFIGANNAGKSIVLRLIADHVANAAAGNPPKLKDAVEAFRGSLSGQFVLALGSQESEVVAKIIASKRGVEFQPQSYQSQNLKYALEKVVRNMARDGQVWRYQNSNRDPATLPFFDPAKASDWTGEWYKLWSTLTNRDGGGALQHWIPETIQAIVRYVSVALPEIHLIPAKRELGEKETTYDDRSGKGLLNELAKLQSPSLDKQDDLKKFARINGFLQEVTGKRDARLTVPAEREHLLVHMDNKVLPLSSLGTGIHEVILLAAFSAIYDGSIMCIEEPEIHLHPVLQRKLIAYLAANTSSQYFIATHSAAFMDTPDAHIFHVVNDGVQTRVRAALTKESQRNVLDDLGYQASDILQANAVIWVEGPSDRIYLNHWIKHFDDRLIEGIHYSIMFYGGGLISHLTTTDDVVADFIALRQLNRKMAILMDSDRSEDSAPLKPHAQRIVEELASGGGIAWITAGREVENYVEGDRLQKALKALHPRVYKDAGPTGRFDHAFHFYRDNPSRPGYRETFKDGDKVGAARLVCETPPDLSRLDLRERLEELCLMICKANGLEPKGVN